MAEERECTRCGTMTDTWCPTCSEWYEDRPSPDDMTVEERAAELRTWGHVEIEISKLHNRVEELVGRPVQTVELARVDRLADDLLNGIERNELEHTVQILTEIKEKHH